MTPAEILFIVQMETQVPFSSMHGAKRIGAKSPAFAARCIAAMMMVEEGYSKAFIGRQLRTERANVYSLLKRTDRILSTAPWAKGYNKGFKLLYLRCVARRTEMEDIAA